MTLRALGILLLAVTLAHASCPSSLSRMSSVSLSPADWPEGDLDHYTQLNSQNDQDKPEARSAAHGGVITGTSEALAVHAGTRCLALGGNSVDCAIVVSLAEITLAIGEYTSFLGHAFLVVRNSSSGEVYGVNGGFDVPRGETNPRTIPSCSTTAPDNGRTVPVPGTLAALQLAADCHGTLPWATLLEPAIYFAEKGFPLTGRAVAVMYSHTVFPILNATDAGRQLLFHADGSRRKIGEIFQQPAVADFLRNVATYGAQYVYTGEFASRLASAVQANGGTLSAADLAQYTARSVPAVNQTYTFPFDGTPRNVTLYGNGLPSYGGVHTVEALNLLELYAADTAAGVDLSQYPQSEPTLNALFRVSSYSWLVGVIAELVHNGVARLETAFSAAFSVSIDFSPQGRMSKEYARAVYTLLSDPNQQQTLQTVFQQFLYIGQPTSPSLTSPRTSPFSSPASSAFSSSFSTSSGSTADVNANNDAEEEWAEHDRNIYRYVRGSHSAAVIASDPLGGVVSVLHSINSEPYGTGIFVDGVAVPNAFCSQQGRIALVGAGNRVPDETEPLIVTSQQQQGTQALLAGSEIGAGLREVSLVKLALMLVSSQFTAKAANDAPDYFNAVFPTPALCHGDASLTGCHYPLNITVATGTFDPAALQLIRQGGQGIAEVSPSLIPYVTGFWVGARFDNADGEQTASAPHRLNGWAEGI